MRFPNNGITGMIVLAAAGWAGAHLSAGSLTLSPAAPFTSGAQVTVGWKVDVSHGFPINIDMSSDGGTTWKPVKAGLTDASGTASYKMTMPTDATTHGKIRVCQGSASDCASIKVSQPGAAPYTLVSSEFTITGSTAIVAASQRAYALGFEPASGKFVANFDLPRDENVLLQAFDFQGRLQATLLQGAFQAGQHKLAVSLPQALAASPAMVVRLTLGEAVHTQAFTRP
ncbi:MAG: hypothetical protein JF616_14515 [Fibrobacteres bacterium]|jgi:hypothetical protein|nr:hypothetical protein [Fibrobacterota bacterium]